MRLTFPYLAALILLSACSSFQRSDDAQAAQKRMIGMSREDILACMGPARKKASEGTTEVWSYISTDGSGSYNSETIKPISGLSTTSGSHSRNFCFVNVVMKDGIVKAVHYNGPSGGILAPNEQCGFAVANCLGPGME